MFCFYLNEPISFELRTLGCSVCIKYWTAGKQPCLFFFLSFSCLPHSSHSTGLCHRHTPPLPTKTVLSSLTLGSGFCLQPVGHPVTQLCTCFNLYVKIKSPRKMKQSSCSLCLDVLKKQIILFYMIILKNVAINRQKLTGLSSASLNNPLCCA